MKNFDNFNKFVFLKDNNINNFYMIGYRNAIFFLVVGETVIFSGWNIKMQQILEDYINQITDQVDKINLIDYTYSQTKGSIRLRSLGGGLRRILSIIKGNSKSLTSKKIIIDLEYFPLLGNKEKLIIQISAVEKNTKKSYPMKTENTDSHIYH